MRISLHRTGVIGRIVIALSLCLCGATQAGMQVQAQPPAESSPKAAPASAPVAPKPRSAAGPAPAATSRPDEKTALSPCIRLTNAVVLGAAIDAERRQALLEQCAS